MIRNIEKMFKKFYLICLTFLVLISVIGCGRPKHLNPIDKNTGKGAGNYFPLTEGSFWRYKGDWNTSAGKVTVEHTKKIVGAVIGYVSTDIYSGDVRLMKMEMTTNFSFWPISLPTPQSIPTAVFYFQKIVPFNSAKESSGKTCYVIKFREEQGVFIAQEILLCIPIILGESCDIYMGGKKVTIEEATNRENLLIKGENLECYKVNYPYPSKQVAWFSHGIGIAKMMRLTKFDWPGNWTTTLPLGDYALELIDYEIK